MGAQHLHRSLMNIFQAPRNLPPAMKHLSGETIYRPGSAKHLPRYASISLENPSTFLEHPRSFLGSVSISPWHPCTQRGTKHLAGDCNHLFLSHNFIQGQPSISQGQPSSSLRDSTAHLEHSCISLEHTKCSLQYPTSSWGFQVSSQRKKASS